MNDKKLSFGSPSINTSPTEFAPIEQRQMMPFKGGKWAMFGDIISERASWLTWRIG